MDEPETSFVRQSLTETIDQSFLQAHSSATSFSRSVLPSDSGRLHKLAFLKTHPQSSKSPSKTSDEETKGILRSLGLQPSPTPPPSHTPSHSFKRDPLHDSDELADNDLLPSRPSSPSSSSSSNQQTPKLSRAINQSKTDSSLKARPTPTETRNQGEARSLRFKIDQLEKERDHLKVQVTVIQAKLDRLSHQNRDGSKLLGLKEFEALEKQFDAQEKLLSGYQRENERSLIELESTRSKMAKMSQLLVRAYGPDWEELMASSTSTHQLDSTIPVVTPTLSTPVNHPVLNTSHPPQSDQDLLNLQVNQVQLLIQGMEHRLISRQIELDDLHRQAKLEQQTLQDSLSHLQSQPTT